MDYVMLALQQEAERGDVEAQFKLGVMHCLVEEDDENAAAEHLKALTWFSKAAEQGHGMAMNMLGELYTNGFGIEPNHEKAFKYWAAAANYGITSAMCSVGDSLEKGSWVQCYEQASTWYEMAAKQGDADAQYRLGMLYANGRGVIQDYSIALGWFRAAAEQGHVEACRAIGY